MTKMQAKWKRGLTLVALLGIAFAVPTLGEVAQAAPVQTTPIAAVSADATSSATGSATCRRVRKTSYYRRRRVTYYRRPRNARYVGTRMVRRNGHWYRVRYYRRR